MGAHVCQAMITWPSVMRLLHASNTCFGRHDGSSGFVVTPTVTTAGTIVVQCNRRTVHHWPTALGKTIRMCAVYRIKLACASSSD